MFLTFETLDKTGEMTIIKKQNTVIQDNTCSIPPCKWRRNKLSSSLEKEENTSTWDVMNYILKTVHARVDFLFF